MRTIVLLKPNGISIGSEVMKHSRLEDMTGGWLVGNFAPTVLQTNQFEVAVKSYKAGDKEAKHYHLQSDEITVIVSGTAVMFNKKWVAGDILVVEKGEATAFEAVSDVTTVVVKSPSIPGDKFLSDAEG